MNTISTYYQVLEIDENLSPSGIKQAYRRLAAYYHPDRNSHPSASIRMRQINYAYSILSDPEKRREYDALLRFQREGAQSASGENGRSKEQQNSHSERKKSENTESETNQGRNNGSSGENHAREEREPKKERGFQKEESQVAQDNFYESLGVLMSASDIDIRRAYSDKLNEYIVISDPEKREMLLQQLTRAYEVLSNQRSKRKYDRQLDSDRKNMARRNRVIEIDTYYDELKVPSDASELQIRKAYGKLVQEVLEIESQRIRGRKMKRISYIFNILSHKKLREEYDRDLEKIILNMRLSRRERISQFITQKEDLIWAAVPALLTIVLIIVMIIVVVIEEL